MRWFAKGDGRIANGQSARGRAPALWGFARCWPEQGAFWGKHAAARRSRCSRVWRVLVPKSKTVVSISATGFCTGPQQPGYPPTEHQTGPGAGCEWGGRMRAGLAKLSPASPSPPRCVLTLTPRLETGPSPAAAPGDNTLLPARGKISLRPLASSLDTAAALLGPAGGGRRVCALRASRLCAVQNGGVD